jgi:hypothetical protein
MIFVDRRNQYFHDLFLYKFVFWGLVFCTKFLFFKITQNFEFSNSKQLVFVKPIVDIRENRTVFDDK